MRLTQLFPQRLFGSAFLFVRSIQRAVNVLSTNSERGNGGSSDFHTLAMNAS
jgi:hypothetical protein